MGELKGPSKFGLIPCGSRPDFYRFLRQRSSVVQVFFEGCDQRSNCLWPKPGILVGRGGLWIPGVSSPHIEGQSSKDEDDMSEAPLENFGVDATFKVWHHYLWEGGIWPTTLYLVSASILRWLLDAYPLYPHSFRHSLGQKRQSKLILNVHQPVYLRFTYCFIIFSIDDFQ